MTVNPVNDAPTISDIPDQSTSKNTPTLPIPFTIGDVETDANSLTISRSSSNPALIPEANIDIAGSGANRTLTLTPASDQFGIATITLTISDGSASATNNFVLTALETVPPFINTQPQSRSVNVGGNVTFQVIAGGTAPLNYQWRSNGNNIPGATSPTLALSNVQLSHAGTYKVDISNVLGSILGGTGMFGTKNGYIVRGLRIAFFNRFVPELRCSRQALPLRISY